MNQSKTIKSKICQAPIEVFQSKLKYAITKFKSNYPFPPIGPRWDRSAKISISILRRDHQKNFL